MSDATMALVTPAHARPTILSIQSTVAYGHVGNSAAAFALMRAGIEVWPVITVHFSNHTGYGQWRGPSLAAREGADVVRGIDERGVLDRCDAVLSGYQGAADMGETIMAAVELVRRRNPRAVYCCDPVMGDADLGMYVEDGIPEFLRDQVIPVAQIVTPNQFELEYLTQEPIDSWSAVLRAADALRARGPDHVLVTSVTHPDVAPDAVAMVAVDDTGAYAVSTPRLPQAFTGAGDLTSAMFLARLLAGDATQDALATTAAIVHGVLSATVEAGDPELQLVAAQEEIVHPGTHVAATRLR